MKSMLYMKTGSYRVVSCEGGDQCGKADAILGFLKKFEERGVSITYSSFPIYASPFGTVIRKFLKNGLSDFNFDQKDELKIKMALYALDRLQFLDVILQNPDYKETLVVLDRSSFSNAVTLAYGVVYMKDLTDKELNSLVRYALWLDNLMIKKLHLEKCVIQMLSEADVWENVRHEDMDINENVEIQRVTDEMYELYEERVGIGWKKIVTKTNRGWNDRNKIFNDIYNFVVSRHGEFNLEVFPKKYTINIQEILKNSYPDAVVDQEDVDKYLKALNENDKDTMHEYGIKVGEQIGKSAERFVFKSEKVQEKFCRIIKKEPDVLLVLEKYLDKNFKDIVMESVDKWTNKS